MQVQDDPCDYNVERKVALDFLVAIGFSVYMFLRPSIIRIFFSIFARSLFYRAHCGRSCPHAGKHQRNEVTFLDVKYSLHILEALQRHLIFVRLYGEFWASLGEWVKSLYLDPLKSIAFMSSREFSSELLVSSIKGTLNQLKCHLSLYIKQMSSMVLTKVSPVSLCLKCAYPSFAE